MTWEIIGGLALAGLLTIVDRSAAFRTGLIRSGTGSQHAAILKPEDFCRSGKLSLLRPTSMQRAWK
jgi:hypothetical protein